MKKKKITSRFKIASLGAILILAISYLLTMVTPVIAAVDWESTSMKNELIGIVKASPADENIVWAGTGQLPNGTSVPTGNGVFKSEDAGTTWAKKTDDVLSGSANITFIVPYPTDANTCFVGTNPAKVYRTTDGGNSWTNISSGLPTSTDFAIAGLAYNNGNLYAGIARANNALSTSYDNDCGCYKNTAPMGSGTWTAKNTGITGGSSGWPIPKPVNGGQKQVSFLASTPTNDKLFLTTVGTKVNVTIIGEIKFKPHVYKTENGGDNWTAVDGTHPNLPTNVDDIYNRRDNDAEGILVVITLTADYLNANVLYAVPIFQNLDIVGTSGSNYGSEDSYQGIYRTEDSGATWTMKRQGGATTTTENGIGFGPVEADPNDSTVLWSGESHMSDLDPTPGPPKTQVIGDGAIHSTDSGTTWTTENAGLAVGTENPTMAFFSISKANSERVFGAATYSDAQKSNNGVYKTFVAPSGPYNESVVINSGAAYATSTSATLTLSCTDTKGSPAGINNMKVSNDPSFSGASWESYNTTKSWTLSSGEGTKNIYAKFKDGDGNESAAASDSIILDLNVPTGSVSINNGAATCSSLTATLTLACNDGAGSGSDKMMVSNSSSFSGASWEANGTSKSWALTPGGDGTRTVYAKFKDKAGRESGSVNDTINYIADAIPPSNASVIINNGDAMIHSLNVTLSLSATDNVGVTKMMISNDASFTGATTEAYSATKSWNLTGSVGDKTVYAKFFDGAGNPSSPASDSISYVTTKSIMRLAGNDRYLTAIEISKAGWPKGAAKVVLARGDMFPDALAGGTLAAKEGAPILLTTSGSLYQATSDEIKRLKATGAIILGGEGAVSPQVIADLKSKNGMSDANIKRYGGANRYETGSLIAKALNPPANKTAIIATGENYPDALASASLAAYLKMPIILIGKSSVPSGAQDALKALGINKTIIVGGEGVVDATAASWLGSNGYPATRLAGSDRYGTAEKIAEYALANGLKADVMTVATGENFPDALAAGPFAGAKKAPIVLVRKTSIPEGTSKVINDNKSNIWSVYIAGGTGVVSEDVKADIGKIIGAQ